MQKQQSGNQQADQRHIQNSYQDYNPQINIQQIKEQCIQIFNDQLACFNKNIQPNSSLAICSKQSKSSENHQMFQGTGGNVILYYRLYQYYKSLNDQNNASVYLQNAQQSFFALHKLEEQNQNLKQSRPMISFYMGPVGFYLIGALIFYEINDLKNFQMCVQLIMEHKTYILKNLQNPKIYYELLYGVPGFLYCLLVLQQNFQFGNLDEQKKKDFTISIQNDVLEIFQLVWQSGINSYDNKIDINQYFDKILPQDFRLVYTFHEKEYFGGAHGLFGVLQMLIICYKLNSQFLDKTVQKLFKKTVEQSLIFIMSLQFKSGNFPSSINSKKDTMCQFCHGSPGSIAPLLQSIELFPDQQLQQQLLQSALIAGDSNWNQGIIKKGYGLCHGISGNAYGFINLYNFTKDKKWLYRAYTFFLIRSDKNIMNFINNFEFEDRYKVGTPDYPFSLMQGLAGDLCFMKDCLQPESSAFPGYEMINL